MHRKSPSITKNFMLYLVTAAAITSCTSRKNNSKTINPNTAANIKPAGFNIRNGNPNNDQRVGLLVFQSSSGSDSAATAVEIKYQNANSRCLLTRAHGSPGAGLQFTTYRPFVNTTGDSRYLKSIRMAEKSQAEMPDLQAKDDIAVIWVADYYCDAGGCDPLSGVNLATWDPHEIDFTNAPNTGTDNLTFKGVGVSTGQPNEPFVRRSGSVSITSATSSKVEYGPGSSSQIPCSGDSGAPGFQNGKIVTIHSRGWPAQGQQPTCPNRIGGRGPTFHGDNKTWLQNAIKETCKPKITLNMDVKNSDPNSIESGGIISHTKHDSSGSTTKTCSRVAGSATNCIIGSHEGYNSSIELEAIPSGGFEFSHWEDSAGIPCTCKHVQFGNSEISPVCNISLDHYLLDYNTNIAWTMERNYCVAVFTQTPGSTGAPTPTDDPPPGDDPSPSGGP